ncbi:MAG: type II toxin-antitoxin system VapC family toxin [Candidatus Omnitrophica bacterium]|nr:type II toxin-antitoxin system VapC family toxin [Candidatus Omnitrophota bacterium]MCA9431648.1 type II toxin-antitoxin system VapC family toxin [Candidatus Omnitrophota bacterium]MCA9440227.1 type II toxin-antitoxin system VapC family toxin [Candidatus Omnitrophota bacterium]MCB9770110.1 type II toxin-antitoxin system VapC family toxin [Candidatus Omnitrophota bacterium]
MPRFKVYLDSSAISFLYADDAPDFQSVTRDFFENYSHNFDLFISQVVLREIDRTVDAALREALKRVVEEYPISILAEDEAEEVDDLAAAYLDAEVLPRSQIEDAYHVAYATVHEMDILLSWNFKHLANVNREVRIQEANRVRGYWKPLRIVSPLEVVSENDE